MLPLRKRSQPWAAWAAVAMCMLVWSGLAGATIKDPAQFLARAENLRTNDHPQFVRMLAQIHAEAPPLSSGEQWHLRYLDAWETMFEGDYDGSETKIRQIIDHSGDPVLTAKASALLLGNLGITRRYEEAFELANHLVASLPTLKDPQARFLVLLNLSQLFNYAGQIDLALKYADESEHAIPPGETLCRPLSSRVAALYNGKRLKSSSPELRRGIDVCEKARQPVIANSMWLVLSSLHLEEGQPGKALALLDRVGASVRTSDYYPHLLSSQVERAQALAALGNDEAAEKAALAAVALGRPGDISEWMGVAYQVLYRIEKKRGNTAAALAYYERYVTHDKGYLNDVSARALAYQVVQQHVLARRLETEALSKQNSILRLQQALATKAMETSRLYIALLLLVLASIVLWLFRLKRSQLRFKKLARQDGLLGILNHQHFIVEAERTLRLLERRPAEACLIVIDLDHFKQVNDTHGHAVGDAVLKRTVAICQQQLRPADLFGRLGGEEFGILLPECPREQGMQVADRIRAAIQSTPMSGGMVAISASVGIACTGSCGYGLQRLCTEADAALYRAKRAGRNRVVTDIEAVDPALSDDTDDSRPGLIRPGARFSNAPGASAP
jgi:diguanylate cyclase (GGDEF)-like protein